MLPEEPKKACAWVSDSCALLAGLLLLPAKMPVMTGRLYLARTVCALDDMDGAPTRV